jgi:hypothetical protein
VPFSRCYAPGKSLSKQTETRVQVPHSQIPKDISGYFDSVIQTYYKIGKPATPKEYYAANKTALKGDHPTQRALLYLKYLGAMESGERGKYVLSEKGTVIGNQLKSKHADEAQRSWQKLLSEHPLYGLLKTYYKESREAGTGGGFGDYLSKHGAQITQRFVKSSGQKLCMLFNAKGLIKYKEDDDTFTLEEVKTPPTPTPSGKGKGATEEITPTGAPMSLHIEININVDANTPHELASKLFEFYWLTQKKPEPEKKAAK